MAKTRSKSFGKQASIFKTKQRPSKDEKPDPQSSSYFNDAVEDFHHDRDKIPLSNSRRSRKESSDEEIYKVDVDTDEENEAADNQDEVSGEDLEDQDQHDPEADMQSDIEDQEEQYLPSAEAWGKKKKAFYNTDYVDKDYGGYLSESDEEAAQLEEIEAKSLQRKLADHVTEEDFALMLPSTAEASLTERETIIEDIDVDIEKLNDVEKNKYFIRKYPEVAALAEDYKAKLKVIERLKPLIGALKKGLIPRTIRLSLIQMQFESYLNYLLNVHFYFILKTGHISIKNHPILDRIVEWKKVTDAIDDKCKSLQSDVDFLCVTLQSSSHNLEDVVKDLEFFEDIEADTFAKKSRAKNKTKDDVEPKDEFYDFEGEEEGDGKRAATYEILKNKGTAPRRKKEHRNPRVKHRRKFEKALHKKRSQLPDVKREISKYGGEIRGIKPNVIKSVKLR